MRADNPEQVIELFATALNSREVDAAITLYEPEATFAPQPGEEVKGQQEIRSALEQFAALQPRLCGEITKVLTAGNVALVQNRWQLEGKQPDGSPILAQAPRASGYRRDKAHGHRHQAWSTTEVPVEPRETSAR